MACGPQSCPMYLISHPGHLDLIHIYLFIYFCRLFSAFWLPICIKSNPRALKMDLSPVQQTNLFENTNIMASTCTRL